MRVRPPLTLASQTVAWQTLAGLVLALSFTAIRLPSQGVNLEQLIELAKSRAATQRPELQKKLEPYRTALETSYKTNWVLIDEKIAEIIKLGDSILPLLLENLEPRTESPTNVNLAKNSGRILHKMEPASFVQALIDIVMGESYTGVRLAIPLLGKTANPRAGEVLASMLEGKATHRNAIIEALSELGFKGAALQVAKLLPIKGPDNDQEAARYLQKVAVPEVVPEVFRALDQVKRGSQVMRYIRILRACAKQDAESAVRLLGYFSNQKLDRTELSVLADTLAVVAPPGHKPTIDKLKSILADGDTGGLELRTAMALRRLGDKSGPLTLRKNLLKKIRGRNKRNYLNHANLGEYYLEFGEFKPAVDAYKSGITHATGYAIKSMLYLQIARAQAKREKWRYVRDALKESKMPFDQIQKAAKDYPEIATALAREPVKKFMDAFGK